MDNNTTTIDEEYIGLYENVELEMVLTIVQRGDQLLAGDVCNVGLMDTHHMDIDPVFSMDENLQAFIEQIEDDERSNIE